MTLLVVVGVATITLWFVVRWLGRGKPCPVLVASFFDNRLAERLGGTSSLIERGDVQEGMRVLDAGCGPGRLTIPLARRVGPTGEVIALDIQEGMLERVRANASRAHVTNIRTVRVALETEADALRGFHQSCHRILLVTVLGELPDPARALRSLYSALKPGGILSITEMLIDPDFVGRKRVRSLAEEAGFEFQQEFGSALMLTTNVARPSDEWQRARGVMGP